MTLIRILRSTLDRLTILGSIKPILSNALLRRMGVLAGGITVAQLLVILATPIATRLYSPQQYGILGLFSAALAITTAVAGLRYEVAIPLAKEQQTAESLAKLAIGLSVISNALLTSILYIGGSGLLSSLGLAEMRPYVWVLPLVTLGATVYQALNYLAVRGKRFRTITHTRVLQSVSQTAAQLGAGVAGGGTAGLLSAVAVGQVAGIGTLQHEVHLRWTRLDMKELRKTASQFSRFALYDVWGALVNVLGPQVAPILLNTFFGLQLVGLFSLAMRLIQLPTSLVGQAVGQVLYVAMAEREGDASAQSELVGKAAASLLIMSLPLFGVVAILGPWFFGGVLGEGWAGVGDYVRLLSPWMALAFVRIPLSTLTLVKGKQKTAMLVTVAETVLRLSALYLGGLLGSPRLAIGLLGTAGAVTCGNYMVWVLSLAGVPVTRWLSVVGLKLLAVTVAVAGTWVVYHLLGPGVALLAGTLVMISAGVESLRSFPS